METAENQVHALMARWQDGVTSKDWSALRDLYAPGAVLFDVIPPLSFEGGDIENGFVEWFDWYDGPIGYERTGAVVDTDAGTAVYRSIDRVGGRLRTGTVTDYRLRHTVVLRRADGADGGWRIVHQHASLPVVLPSGDTSDGRVVLSTP